MKGIDYSRRQHNFLSINFEQLQNSNCYAIHCVSNSYDRHEIHKHLIQSDIHVYCRQISLTKQQFVITH